MICLLNWWESGLLARSATVVSWQRADSSPTPSFRHNSAALQPSLVQCTEGAISCCQGQQGFVSLFECSLKKQNKTKKKQLGISKLLSYSLLRLFSFASDHELLFSPYFFESNPTEKTQDIFILLVILLHPVRLSSLNTV